MIDNNFWKGKKVFITGHTGFKGSWLCIWLNSLGADITGYALNPPTEPNLFGLCRIDKILHSVISDIRDLNSLKSAMVNAQPEIVIHMAAQPLVMTSYKYPVETYATNLMGTVNVLEAVRQAKGIKAVINVTTDKCYENREWYWSYREDEPMGGYDPYSNSKACSELATAAYRKSFFNADDYKKHGVSLASARAGNVIGGGDWADARLIPDCVRALLKSEAIIIRNPYAIRPWQHVLESLSGYILLAQKLYIYGSKYAQAWNFGPDDNDAKPVEFLVKTMCASWGDDASYKLDTKKQLHEAKYLKLDCSKAKTELGWHPRWNVETAIRKVIEWTKAYKDEKNLQETCLKQIKEYCQRTGER